MTRSLSRSRMRTYQNAVVVAGDLGSASLALYEWNLQISAALLTPLQVCEVVIRNAVSDALSAVYGERWPWSPSLERSLPSYLGGYNQRSELLSCRSFVTAAKVTPELRFVFWQSMFNGRYDGRLWNAHLRRVFPNLDNSRTVAQLRREIFLDLEYVRHLRNRIAHHEPIFARSLQEDFDRIVGLIWARCAVTAEWMMERQRVTEYLKTPF